MSAAAPETAQPPRRVWTEALGIWALSAAAISLSVHLGFGDTTVSVVKSLALIYLPIAWLVWRRRDLDRYGLHLDRIGLSLGVFAAVSLATLPAFWIAAHFWNTLLLHQRFAFRWPPSFGTLVAGELFAVALPEELFYRGYLQTRLADALPARGRFLGAPIGWALPVASIVFVAGHLVVRPAPWQLAIFFPAMAFGWMRLRTDGLLAPVLYHALCNLGMVVLQSSYR